MSSLEYEENFDIGIDLTPLIDVMFIMLLFFILTASFSQPVLEAVLPKAEETVETGNDIERVFVVTADGDFVYNGQPVGPAQLKNFFADLEPGPLLFNIDENAKFAWFVAVVDAAKAAGREDFAIQTRPQ